MDYNKVMSKASENKHHASTAASIKRYSTEVSASKKPPPRPSGVQSDAVKAFLAKRKQEEEVKAHLAEKRKQELLELRSIAKNGRKANAMAKRTKDNNFMTNFSRTAELAVEQTETANFGSVQRRFTQQPLSPQWRQSSKTMSNRPSVGPASSSNPSTNQRTRPNSRLQQPHPSVSGSNLNFYDLLKVAAKKQHEPLDILRLPKKEQPLSVQEQGRMMTTDEKRRFHEELARKHGRPLDEVHVPKRSRKKYVPGDSGGEEINDNEHQQVSTSRSQTRGRSAGVAPAAKQSKNPVPTNRPTPSSSQPTAKKYLHLNERTPNSTMNGNSVMKKVGATLKTDERMQKLSNGQQQQQQHQHQQHQQHRRHESGIGCNQSVRGTQNTKRAPNRLPPPSAVTGVTSREDGRGNKAPVKVVTNNVPMARNKQVPRASVSSSSKASSAKQSTGFRTANPTNGKFAEPSSSRMTSTQMSQRPNSQLQLPSSCRDVAKLRPKMEPSLRPGVRARQPSEAQSKSRGPPQTKQLNRNTVGPSSSSRQSFDVGARALSRPSASNPPSRIPPPSGPPQSRPFPPRDLAPRQFPPRDLERRPLQRPPLKRRIESDDDDEYDEEMNDFIDDGPIEDGNDLDYSEHIRQIFGYDRSKYRYEPDDMCMESSFLQQMKEEAISAKMGILEDLEDIQREEEEMKRRTVRLKKPK